MHIKYMYVNIHILYIRYGIVYTSINKYIYICVCTMHIMYIVLYIIYNLIQYIYNMLYYNMI